MARVIPGYIAKCNEKISKELFEYEKSKGHNLNLNQEYGVLFLNNNLTKPIFFRFDGATMNTIVLTDQNLLPAGVGSIVNQPSAKKQSFNVDANFFFRDSSPAGAGALTHKTFANFSLASDKPVTESSSGHTKNYIHI